MTSDKNNLKEEILKFFKGDLEDSEDTLTKYSHDASLLEVRPKLVLFPKDAEDVKNLVKWVSQNKDMYVHPGNNGAGLYITARCAGTCMSGGAIGESIILDFTRYMNKLIGGPVPIHNLPVKNKKKHNYQGGYPLVSSYISVQPGMFYRDFEKITLEKGLILPCFTASKEINAMGGMFGNNSAGERTLKYGQTSEYVLSSKAVFADGNEYEVKPLNKDELQKKMAQGDFEGNIYKNIFNLINENEDEIKHAKPNVSKNSAGYYIWNVVKGEQKANFSALLQPSAGTFRLQNSPSAPPQNSLPENFSFDLNKLLVGSQGTLGIVTEITFKIIPENKHSKLVAIFMNDLNPLGRLVDEILTLNPETLETYDDKTMKLAVKFFPDFLKNKGLVGMIKFMWSFLPEFFMLLSSGFPKLIILAEFAGENEAELEKSCLRLKEKIKDFKLKIHITESEIEANKYWDIRRESFALLRKHVKGMRTAPFIDDIIVRPEFLPKFIPELNGILSQYKSKMMYTLAGHAGDGNFHIIPLMDFKRSDTAQIILELGEKVYDLAVKYHGSIAGEHNDGLIRTPYLGKMYSAPMLEVFKKIKDIFDPKNIFNAGKKVPTSNWGGTKEYIASHIAVEHNAVHKA
ncbi:FAD-binding oxidoreductase [Candidatus Nomurabacteria bacterium]|nr:FAD-binding oxidoreductase [Candidatus Nomurabacteria bacterium]